MWCLLLLVLSHFYICATIRDTADAGIDGDGLEIEDVQLDGASKTVQLAGAVYLTAGEGEKNSFETANLQLLTDIPHEPFEGTLMANLTREHIEAWSNGSFSFLAKDDPHNEKAKAIWVSQSRLLDMISKKALPGSPQDELPYVVFEGDIHLQPGWRTKVEDAIQHTPQGWDIIVAAYWGSRYCPDEISQDLFKVSGSGGSLQNYQNFAFYSGLQTYVVTPRSARKLLEHTRKRPVHNIDREFLQLAAEGAIDQYFVGKNRICAGNFISVLTPPWTRLLSCSRFPL